MQINEQEYTIPLRSHSKYLSKDINYTIAWQYLAPATSISHHELLNYINAFFKKPLCNLYTKLWIYTLFLLYSQKLHVFLFQEVLVITRTATHNEQLCYQVCRPPIPVKDLILEDLQDGEVRLGGSIRGAFSNNERSKNALLSSLSNIYYLKCYCLMAWRESDFLFKLFLKQMRLKSEGFPSVPHIISAARFRAQS